MTREEILAKAKEAVTGQREQDYGRPENSFEDIAALWTAYKNVTFSPKDVAIMMALLKIARIKTGHNLEDSFIDLCGYGSLAGEMAEQKTRPISILDEPGNPTGTYAVMDFPNSKDKSRG